MKHNSFLGMSTKVFHGNFFHTVDGKFECLEGKYMTVVNGVIKEISDKKPAGNYEYFECSKSQFIIPGLVDTHCHASQYIFAGIGMDCELLEWLNTYTYPQEAKYKDVEHAKRVYTKLVEATVRNGTTTAVYFATLHTPASLALADICRQKGQRAYVGRLSMDFLSPDYYREGTEESIKNEREFLSKFDYKDSDIVFPAITPRFIPTSTEKQLQELGKLAKEFPKAFIQSHISEMEEEVKMVRERFSHYNTYASVFIDNGLMRNPSVFAHGIFLTNEELDMMSKVGASIAHCPNANWQVFEGELDVRNCQKHGVNVSIGTDIAGGETPSLIGACRDVVLCSRAVFIKKRELGQSYNALTLFDAFAMATEGGAKAVGLQDKIGNFKVGKEFDAVVCDAAAGVLDCFGFEKPKELFEKFFHMSDDRNIIRVYTRGNCIKKID